MTQKTALVCGAGGFIGSHMCARLKAEGYFVRGLSRSAWRHDYPNPCDEYWTCDLRDYQGAFFKDVDECYQFACEVGGLGYIMDHTNDAAVLRNSTLIDLNVLEACRQNQVGKIFFASSACVYPDLGRPLRERDAYPANPSNEFAWQKLFAERLYQSYASNYGMNIRIGRLFNTYGVGMAWEGGREKVVGALCRKVAEAEPKGIIELWGDGMQRRSLTYVADAVLRVRHLMAADYSKPVNIGPELAVSIRQLAWTIMRTAGKDLQIKYGAGPVGVPEICGHNFLASSVLGAYPWLDPLSAMETVYPWVEKQVLAKRAKAA